jgi:ABC-type nickel/cobalt efflux system permease component RcnA
MTATARMAGRRRGVGAGVLLAVVALLLLPLVVSAHPLGNFTINHYSGVRVGTDAVVIDHVLDMAEIPTFSERADMDTDGDLTVSDAEAAASEAALCDSTRGSLDLRMAGQPLDLRVAQTGLSFPQGQGAVTLRLVCVYRAELPDALPAGGAAFTFSDSSFAERRGWREIVVQGDGATLAASDAPADGTSQRLAIYPTDLLATPSDQARASWSAAPGGVLLPALVVPDARPVGAAIADPGATATTASQPSAVIPNGITDLGGDVMALFQARELTLPVILVSMLVAAGLGALHALSPGHGKTVMAAYLVGSRGTATQAIGLGLTVTVSHTLGVLALGVISLSAASLIPPERLYPILGVLSGSIVVAIGVWLVWGRIQVIRRNRSENWSHHEAIAHDHDHVHEHAADDHGHDHDHEHTPERSHAREPAAEPEGWHDHGGRGHTHLPPRGTTLSWRGLFALGLAGGMVPSVSALILLLGSISLGRPAFGVGLTVAFGVGMAVVLVGVGMGLVYARGYIDRMTTRAPAVRVRHFLPTATAVIVLGAGLLITTQALMTLH